MPSGDGNSIFTLATSLEKLGHDVIILTPKWGQQRYHPRQIFFTSMEYNRTINIIPIIYRYIQANIDAARTRDILVCFLGSPVLAKIGEWIFKKTKVPVVCNFGNALFSNFKGSMAHFFREVHWYLPRFLINNSVWIRLFRFSGCRYVVNTHFQKRQLLARGFEERSFYVIPNCVNGNNFVKKDKREAKRAFGLKDSFNISYIGSFQGNKGFVCLLESLSSIKKEIPNVLLVLAGSTKKPKKLMKIVKMRGLKDSVIFFGKIDVSLLLSATDILTLPYFHNYGSHMYPNILLEGMAIGVPIVTSDLEIIREVVEPDVTALVHKPGDPGDLAQKVIALAKDEALRKQMEQIQPSIFMERYNADKVGRQYEALLREILA